MRTIISALLNLIRTLWAEIVENSHTISTTALQMLFVLGMLIIAVLISLFFVVADNATSTSPEKATLIQGKYAVLAGYPLLGILLGIIFRWNRLSMSHFSGWKRRLGDALKVGIISGGLASGKLAGIVAIMREVVADADTFVSTETLLMAMIPIIVIVLVTFFTAREAISRNQTIGA